MKNTLHLPKTDMPIQANLPANEPGVYALWADVIDRMKRDGKNPFILHDGPPYANGDIHIGHALNKILKDFAVKFQYFGGRAVEFIPGWDCHGLPIEKRVGAKIRIGGGNMREPHYIRQVCRNLATEQIANQKEQFKALGVIADWNRHYETMSRPFESMIYTALCELLNKGLLVERQKPVYWSWAENTALAEAEVDYRERTDESVYVAFPTATETFPGGLMVWTTTPWTLPANVAVAMNPNIPYVVAKVEGYPFSLLVADDAFDRLREKGLVTLKIAVLEAGQFEGWKLKHPIYPDQTVPVVMADFVTADTGTGCVHIAPGHGGDDYAVALKYNLPVVMPVGPSGRYTEGKYQDKWIFHDDGNTSLEKDTYKACNFFSNRAILEDLKAQGLLLHTEYIKHNYPYCSRSNTPVIFRATKQWFLDLEKLRAQVLKAFEEADFIPENTRNRMRPMLEGRPDWCISRQRVWGVPIAFIRQKGPNGQVNSHPDILKHIQGVFDQEGVDVWINRTVEDFNPPAWKDAPFVAITSEHFEKINDILDVWFDSGLSWNVLGGRQADLYLEGNDQHRGWFQSSLWLAVALTGYAPFKKVLTHGFVVDQEGKKMSKSEGNVVSPLEITKKYGAEVLRYWVASTNYTQDVPCSEGIIKQASEGYKKIRNTLRFLVANLDTQPTDIPPTELYPVDWWILDKSQKVFAEVHKTFADYQYHVGLHRLNDYINNDLSGIFMNAAKDRLYCGDDKARNSALLVMSKILRSFLGLLAPLFTYTAQEVFSYCPAWFRAEAKDIFDLTYTPLEELVRYEHTFYLDEEYWKKALAAFHTEFDRIKTEKKARDTLEVVLESKDNSGGGFFAGAEDWFVVSHWYNFSSDREALGEFTVDDKVYRIVKSHQEKCRRCWKRKAEGELCQRCKIIVSGLQST